MVEISKSKTENSTYQNASELLRSLYSSHVPESYQRNFSKLTGLLERNGGLLVLHRNESEFSGISITISLEKSPKGAALSLEKNDQPALSLSIPETLGENASSLSGFKLSVNQTLLAQLKGHTEVDRFYALLPSDLQFEPVGKGSGQSGRSEEPKEKASEPTLDMNHPYLGVRRILTECEYGPGQESIDKYLEGNSQKNVVFFMAEDKIDPQKYAEEYEKLASTGISVCVSHLKADYDALVALEKDVKAGKTQQEAFDEKFKAFEKKVTLEAWSYIRSNASGYASSEFIWESMASKYWDCETSSILSFDIMKGAMRELQKNNPEEPMDLGVRIIALSGHVLVSTKSFFFETTSFLDTNPTIFGISSISEKYPKIFFESDDYGKINGITYYSLGIFLESLGKKELAYDAYGKAAQLMPEHFDAVFAAVAKNMEKRNYLAAKNILDSFIELNQNEAYAYFNRAYCKSELNQPCGSDFRKAYELMDEGDPNRKYALENGKRFK